MPEQGNRCRPRATDSTAYRGESPRKFKASFSKGRRGRGSHSRALRLRFAHLDSGPSAGLRTAGGPRGGARPGEEAAPKAGKGLLEEKGEVVNLTTGRQLGAPPQPLWPLPAEGAAPGKPLLLPPPPPGRPAQTPGARRPPPCLNDS